MPEAKHQQYEIVILGGGMVGLSLACALQTMLAEQPVKILLLESQPIRSGTARQPGFDVRSTVLSFATVEAFKKLGLWSELHEHAEAIDQIHVSDQRRFGSTRINAGEEGIDALGYVLANQVIGTVLNQTLLKGEQVEILSPVTVTAISNKADSAQVECESEGVSFALDCSLLVLAEGGRSGLAEQLGISRRQIDYGQVAIIANVTFDLPHQQVAFERFTPSGPLALLPLSDFQDEHRSALIWTQQAENYAEVLALEDEQFLNRLQDEFGHRLGNFRKVGERAAFPLSLQEAEEQIRHNLVLLGNVAHTLHPVAGQGFNLAFRDAMHLAENIQASLQKGIPPGAYERLDEYLKTILNDQKHTIAFSHYLTSFFSSERELLIWSRKAALLGIDFFPPLRKALSRQAMGMSDTMVKVEPLS